MIEEDVRKNITTPAVLEAFERAKLSDLPKTGYIVFGTN